MRGVPGDYAEFGVYKGHNFVNLMPKAKAEEKVLHGFDSFQGMAEPTPQDFESTGSTGYPKGHLSTRGPHDVIKRMEKAGYFQGEDYFLWEGFIPEVFHQAPVGLKFCYCFIDLDQYQPTVDSISYCWPRLSVGGVISFHDYFPDKNVLASQAINEFRVKYRNHLGTADHDPKTTIVSFRKEVQ